MEIDINKSKFVGELVKEWASPPEICVGVVSSATLEQSSLRFGYTSGTFVRTIGEVTKNFAYNVLSYLGVNQNIAEGYRYLHSTFGGVGLISLSAEVTIGRLNMFLQHWDMPNPIGRLLRASLETLQLKI